MATEQPPHPLPNAAKHTVSFDRFHHVFRTGGIKTASGGQHGRDPALIHTKDSQRAGRGGAHWSDRRRWRRVALRAIQRCKLHVSMTFWRARSISLNVAFSTGRLGFSTMSHLDANSLRWSRNASRIRRLIRLRSTAFPTALGTVRPRRGAFVPPGSAGRARQKAANNVLETRKPWS